MRHPARSAWPLYLASMASGGAALLFEVLLFRRLELLLGRSLEASALIFAAYMLGLGLGALLALHRFWRPWPRRCYAVLEVISGGLAMGLVLLAPSIMPVIAGQNGPLVAAGLLLALLLPSVAMGWVLPVLAFIVSPGQQDYQRQFPRLYALNTLGAVLGVLAAIPLIDAWGIPMSAAMAAGLNLLAAALVLLANRPGGTADDTTPPPFVRLDQRITELPRAPALLAALGSGFALLALEVLALRSLSLHLRPSDWLFSLVLACVIAGISLGAWQWRRLSLPAWAAIAAVSVLLAYLGLDVWPRTGQEFPQMLLFTALTVGPVSVASGALFAGLSAALRARLDHSASSSGVLMAVNTLGAASGALLMAHLIIPHGGLDRAWLSVFLSYGLLLALVSQGRAWLWATSVLLLVGLLWPAQSGQWMDRALEAFPGYERIARRDARDASLQFAVRRVNEQVVAERLLSDGFSMSGSELDSLRYMRLFAFLPQALHPQIQEALLISYGLGNTAEALLSDPSLQHLRVADTSAATVELARRYRRHDPLEDSRVSLRLDDGRHVLLSEPRQYDLITAEPPPPRLAGVVNLYTREYFELLKQRLKPGGMVSYWLPVDQLSHASSDAILRGFCEAFADCSLWAGSHYNWIMLGSRPGGGRNSAARLDRLWPVEDAALLRHEVGLERPEQLLNTFIADAAQIRRWLGPAPALSDDWPGRLERRPIRAHELQRYFLFMDDREAQQRLGQSDWARATIGDQWIERAEPYWLWQPLLNGQARLQADQSPELLELSLQQGLRQPLLKMFGKSWRELAVALPADGAQGQEARAMAAMLARRWEEAAASWRELGTDSARRLAHFCECQVRDCVAARED